jgi:hypothetical protein
LWYDASFHLQIGILEVEMTSNKSFRKLTVATGLSVAMIFLTSAEGYAAEFKRIKSLKEFKSAVVGRTLVGKTRSGAGVRVVHRADGVLSGIITGGIKVTATWRWRRGYYCRKGTAGNEIIVDDCPLILISGKTVRFVLNRGRGSTIDYKIRN